MFFWCILFLSYLCGSNAHTFVSNGIVFTEIFMIYYASKSPAIKIHHCLSCKSYISFCLSRLCGSNVYNIILIGALFAEISTIYSKSTVFLKKKMTRQTCATGAGLSRVVICQPAPAPVCTRTRNLCRFLNPWYSLTFFLPFPPFSIFFAYEAMARQKRWLPSYWWWLIDRVTEVRFRTDPRTMNRLNWTDGSGSVQFSSGKTQTVQFTVQAKGGVNWTELNWLEPVWTDLSANIFF